MKIKIKKRDTRFWNGDPASWGGSHEGGNVSTHSETYSWLRTLGSFRAWERNTVSEGNVLDRQVRENSPQRLWQANSTYQVISVFRACCSEWGLGVEFRFQGLEPRKRTGADCCEDTLRELV